MAQTAAGSNAYFVIVGARDNPMYEVEFGPLSRQFLQQQQQLQQQQAGGQQGGPQKDDHRHLNQFVVHAALDVIDELVWTTNSMYVGSSASGIIENYNADGRYLKVVDKFNEWFISAYICASNVKLMLLHDSRNEDNIKNFFQEIHELYIKVLMNPLQEQDGAIESKAFDQKVRAIGRKYL